MFHNTVHTQSAVKHSFGVVHDICLLIRSLNSSSRRRSSFDLRQPRRP